MNSEMSKPPMQPKTGRGDWRHDFGEPLLAIRLYAQMLQSEPDLDRAMQKTLLEAIEGQAIALHQKLEEVFGETLANSDR